MDEKDKRTTVWINVSDKYIKKDIDRKDGHGTFHMVTIPRGTSIEGRDVGLYSFITDVISEKDKGYSSFPFDAGARLTIKRSVKQSDGTYDVLTKNVRVEQLRDAIQESYDNYKKSLADVKKAETSNSNTQKEGVVRKVKEKER